jgi:hypothetical protein
LNDIGVAQQIRNLEGDQLVACCQLATSSRSKGQQAMAVAFAYPEPEKGGRGKKKTVEISSTLFSAKRLQQAR